MNKPDSLSRASVAGSEAEPGIAHIQKRDGRIVPFTKLRISNALFRAAVAVGERNRDDSDRIADQVVAQLKSMTWAGANPTVEEIQDLVEKVLIENGKYRIAKAYILYRAARTRKRIGRESHDPRAGDPIPWKKIWNILNWAVDHQVHTILGLNGRIRRGEFGSLVRECEDEYQLDVLRAADAILKRKEEVRVVIVAGPSSSGKTTTTLKISEHLAREGFKFLPFHVDHYFRDLDAHPRDEFGDYDYETPQALDLELISGHLQKLLNGESVMAPKFDYKAGKRIDNHHEIKLEKGQILLIDSLHGLHADLTGVVPPEAKFRLYIETLLQMRDMEGNYIRWADMRLMRRMTRDHTARFVDPKATLNHWRYVRDAELDHILPFANRVDYVVNGALSYELPVWKTRWADAFALWENEYAGNDDRKDTYDRVRRVRALLDSIEGVSSEDEKHIPPGALLREFIGGSAYTY